MIRRFLAAVILVGVGSALLVIAWPSLFGLAEAPVVAQLVSVRALTAALAVGAAFTLALVAMLWSAARRFLAGLALLAMLFALVNVAVLSTRGFGDESFPTRAPAELSVLTWNTLGDAPGVDRIVDLVIAEQADIVVLPETSQETAVAIAEATRLQRRPMWVYSYAFDYVAKARSTSILVSVDLGEYSVDDDVGNTSVLPSMVLRPVDGTGPTIIGVHPVAPIPGELENWRADLQWVESVCRGEQVILAGDLNATADQFRVVDPAAGVAGLGFGDCLNAGLLTGNGAVGTWPTRLPPLLGTPIDSIFVTPDITVTGMRVITTEDCSGSDHRPVVARLILE
ncbi:MAG: endonuclease/exonuclease/phosphatase family protein [Microbacteriaceae bacterium]|nr:endonuclease/exonuclease/phosphatase family protein [Microbacteriaceae bacterium]